MVDWDLVTKPGKPGGRPVEPSEIVYCGDVSLVIGKHGAVFMIDTSDTPIVEGINWRASRQGYAAWKRRDGQRLENIYMHRLLLKAPDGLDVDHINGVPWDNRRSNLRVCTRAQNIANVATRSASGMVGAYRHSSGYQARICINGRREYLGIFPTAAEAHDAYMEARKVGPEFFSRAPARQ